MKCQAWLKEGRTCANPASLRVFDSNNKPMGKVCAKCKTAINRTFRTWQFKPIAKRRANG